MHLLSLYLRDTQHVKNRAAYHNALYSKIQALEPDIILMQDAFQPDNPAAFVRRLSDTWHHYHHFSAETTGSRLYILSKYAITATAFHPFRLQAEPEGFLQSSTVVRSGIGLARVATPAGDLDVYNIQTVTKYHGTSNYTAFNEANLFEATRFIQSHSGDSDPVVVSGNIHSRPDQPGYQLLTRLAQLDDASLSLQGETAFTLSANYFPAYMFARSAHGQEIEVVTNGGSSEANPDYYGLLAEVLPDNSKPLSVLEANVSDILAQLYQRLNTALAKTESAQVRRVERAILALGSVADTLLLTGVIKRLNKRLGQRLRRVMIISALAYAAFEGIRATNYQTHKQALQTILDEVQQQIEANTP